MSSYSEAPSADFTIAPEGLHVDTDRYFNPSASIAITFPPPPPAIDIRLWHVGASNVITLKNDAGVTFGSILPGMKANILLYRDSSDVRQYVADTSLITDVAPRTLSVQTNTVGNVGSGEDDLHTFSVPGSTLVSNGQMVDFIAGGTFAASVANKRIRAKFGGTTIFDSGALAISLATDWRLEGQIIRTGAATQKAICSLSTSSGTLSAYADYSTPGETLTGAIALTTTGEATNDNDVVEEMFSVRFVP